MRPPCRPCSVGTRDPSACLPCRRRRRAGRARSPAALRARRPGHFGLGELERLEHADALVLVRVGRFGGQRVDEIAAEQRRELLGAVARRGDDGPARSRKLLDERTAGARRVDEHHLLGRQLASSGLKSAGVMSGPGRLNLASRPSKLPWPISVTKTTSSGPPAWRRRRAPWRSLPASRGRSRPCRLPRLHRPDNEPLARDAEPLGRLRELRAPLMEQLAVLGIAGQAHDDQQERP